MSDEQDDRFPREKFSSLQELFSDPERWTQEFYALNAAGERTHLLDKYAVRWCLSGGIRLIYSLTEESAVTKKIHDQIGESERNIPAWNDRPGRTAAEVLDLVTRAGV